ncbi:MAG: S8 family serine peptidase [Bacteriovoracaceae bacterium]
MNKTTTLLFFLFFFYSCNSKDTGSPETVNVRVNPDDNQPVPVEVSTEGADPLVPYAWHLQNTGQTSFSSGAGTAGNDLRVLRAHDLGYIGRGIRIAVSDSGMETNHPDLSANQLAGEHRSYSGAPSTWHNSQPIPEDGNPHGTSVTGLISAVAGNGIGSMGVAPGAKWAGFYFIGQFKDTSSSYESRVLDQIIGDFDIFNYSYGYANCFFVPTTPEVVAAYKKGVTTLRNGKGAIYLKAAGNDYQGKNSQCHQNDSSTFWGNANTNEDQNHPYLVVTAASNAAGKVSSYSSPGSNVWITSAGGEFGDSAPAMITTDFQGCSKGFSTSSSWSSNFNRGQSEFNSLCNYTNIMNGTSSAAPTLAGVVALILEANPELSWRDVKHILATTANPIQYSTAAYGHPANANLAGHVYDYNYIVNAAGMKFSNTFGFGRVDAEKAVTLAKNYTFPLGAYVETETNGDWDYRSNYINLVIPDNSANGTKHSLNVTHHLKVEAVQINVQIDHPFISDIGVELTSPSGTVSKILRINSNIKDQGLYGFTLLSNAFYGESSGGNWTIKVIDGKSGNSGRLVSWELKINGGQQ